MLNRTVVHRRIKCLQNAPNICDVGLPINIKLVNPTELYTGEINMEATRVELNEDGSLVVFVDRNIA